MERTHRPLTEDEIIQVILKGPRPIPEDIAVRTYVRHACTPSHVGRFVLDDEQTWMEREFNRGMNRNVVMPSLRYKGLTQ
jgi:hypothetical protein